MSVAEMKIMGVIGPKQLLSSVLRQVVLHQKMHMIDALTRVNSADFFLPPTERNIEVLEEEPHLKPYTDRRDFSEDEKIISLFHTLFDIKPQIKEEYLNDEYDYDNFMKQFYEINKVVGKTVQEIEDKLKEIETKKEYITNLKYLYRFKFDLSSLNNMKYLTYRLIKVSKENFAKLRRNYNNIPAIILKAVTESKYVTLLYFAPVILEETLERIFSSLNYTVLPIPRGMSGTAQEVVEQLNSSIELDQKTIESLKGSIEIYKEQYKDKLEKMYSRLEMEKKIEELKSHVALGTKSFFLFGFVPTINIETLKEKLEKIFGDKLIILVDEIKKTYLGTTPPTKLNNAKLFKPFESLVKMFGTPSYKEKDPTIFFGLTYMFIFGAMFGDVGQGFIFLLSGLVLEFIYHQPDFGGVLNRLGLSSMVFGFVYGSVFGSEEILPALIIRPMSNIDNMLIYAVALGILLLSFSYIFSIINAKQEKDFEEGLFGKNGLAGFSFYILLLYTVYQVFIMHNTIVPIIFILVLLLGVILFKKPLASRIFHTEKSFTQLSANDYIEEGFGLIEMLLSMLSNTISFLRVGAFALNHVGLYIAFLTLANMMSSAWGNWTVLIIGNIVILTLEGLIVFIQALRLEYYELFTKYYQGDGIEYNPAKINFTTTQKSVGRLFFKAVAIPMLIKNRTYNYINPKAGV